MKRRRSVKLAGAAAAVFGSGLNFGAMGASGSIKIGQSAPFSGPMEPQVQSSNRGAALAFDSVNRIHATAKRLKGQFGGLEVNFTGRTNTGCKFTELVYVTGAGRFAR